jgi:amidase
MNKSTFPLAEPVYVGKRVRDFSPFAGALATLAPGLLAGIHALVIGKSIPALQELFASGQLSAEQLLLYYIDRIQRFDVDKLNSVMELNPAALAWARRADAERTAGNSSGLLHGIPVLLKDNVATGDGMHTTAGSGVMRDWQSSRDAALVTSLRRHGAIILGKANLSEWANYLDPSMPNGFSALGGQTRHPYGPFDPLGSSAGSGVAVAAGLAPVAVGSETQGSIIMPAIANSLVGIKTSKGLVSGDRIIPLVDWLDVAGPMARTVTDAALLLEAMTASDPGDEPAPAAIRPLDFTAGLRPGAAVGLRIGIPQFDEAAASGVEVTPELRAHVEADFQVNGVIFEQSAAVFRRAGMELVEIPAAELPGSPNVLPILEYGFRDSFDRFAAEMGEEFPVRTLADVAAHYQTDPANLAPYGFSFLSGSANSQITPAYYAEIKSAAQHAAQSGLRDLLVRYRLDVMLVNTLTQAYCAAGFPAIAVPAGYREDGEPVGIVLTGDWLAEPVLIAAAYAFEQATQARREPALPGK